jgi:hypothetical protein
MAKALTTASTLGCNHAGKASLTGSDKLKVQGKPVVTKSNAVTPLPLSGCTVADSNTTLQCKAITSLSNDTASKLKVSGSPVLLDALSGQTNGKPENSVLVTAKQQKLNAV